MFKLFHYKIIEKVTVRLILLSSSPNGQSRSEGLCHFPKVTHLTDNGAASRCVLDRPKAQALCMAHAAEHVTFQLSPNQGSRREAKVPRRPVGSLEQGW